jgi:hypothetical protein
MARVLVALALGGLAILGPIIGGRAPVVRAVGLETLTVELYGNGTGAWKSTDDQGSPDGVIDCERSAKQTTGTCSHAWADSLTVYFEVTAAPGTLACLAITGFCGRTLFYWSIDVNAPSTVSDVSFVLDTETLTVSTTGSGSGNVSAPAVGIDCPPSCSNSFVTYGTAVALSATAAAGSRFDGWGGACTGNVGECTFTITGNASVQADFEPIPAVTPSPRPTETPSPAPTKRTGGNPTPMPSPGPMVTATPAVTATTAASAMATLSGAPTVTATPVSFAGVAPTPTPIAGSPQIASHSGLGSNILILLIAAFAVAVVGTNLGLYRYLRYRRRSGPG